MKKFTRKCGWCGRSFNHWRSHWTHEKKCRTGSSLDGPNCHRELKPGVDPQGHKLTDHVNYNEVTS